MSLICENCGVDLDDQGCHMRGADALTFSCYPPDVLAFRNKRIADLQQENERLKNELVKAWEATDDKRMLASATAHRACCGVEHDPSVGKLHGNCVVCGVPWPCETAKFYIHQPTEAKGG